MAAPIALFGVAVLIAVYAFTLWLDDENMAGTFARTHQRKIGPTSAKRGRSGSDISAQMLRFSAARGIGSREARRVESNSVSTRLVD